MRLVAPGPRRRLVVDDYGDAVALACRGCGGPKGAGRGVSYCADCQAARDEARFCQRCGVKPKRPGIGQRLCLDCRPARRYASPEDYSPCAICGERKPKGRGRRICDDCQGIAKDVREAKLRARTMARRKTCVDCGRTRGYDRTRYCDRCAALHAEGRHPKLCYGCGEKPRRAKGKRYCEDCQAYADRRRKSRAKRRSRTSVPAKPRKRTAEQRTRMNENRRIASRLKAEKEGRTFNEAISLGRTRSFTRTTWHSAPGPPIAAAIREDAIHRRITLGEYAALSGIPTRTVARWRSGERIRLESLDKALDLLGVDWQEVYDPRRFPHLYSPWDWPDVVDAVSRALDNVPLIGQDAVYPQQQQQEAIAA